MDTAIMDVRTGSGEEAVMSNVTVQMEMHVIRLMDRVSVVSPTEKLYSTTADKCLGS